MIEFLYNYLAITTSGITLLFTFTVLGLVAICFAYVVNFTLNQKAWGEDSFCAVNYVSELICKIVFTTYEIEKPSEVKHVFLCGEVELELEEEPLYHNQYHLREVGGDRYYNFIKERLEDGVPYSHRSQTLSTWLERAEVERHLSHKTVHTSPTTTTKQDFRAFFTWKTLIVLVAIDVALFYFSQKPVATLSILGTVSTIFSVRWLSGKLAATSKVKDSHEERINKLEEG